MKRAKQTKRRFPFKWMDAVLQQSEWFRALTDNMVMTSHPKVFYGVSLRDLIGESNDQNAKTKAD